MYKLDHVLVKEEIVEKQFTCSSYDELSLFTRSWKSTAKPKAVILILHGLGEHSGRYDYLAKKFVESGYFIFAFDMRGHGKSGGKRGQSSSYQNLLKDLEIICHKVEKEFQDIPRILYGHSFGGNLAVNFAISNLYTFSGIILTSPWLKLEFQIPRGKLFLGRLASYFFPNLITKTGLDPEGLSRNPEIVHNYIKDPLVHDKVSLRLFFEIVDAGVKASGSIYKINSPMLVMHGSADKITSLKTTREFVMNTGRKTTFKEWPDNFHELHNDFNAEEVFDFMIEWLNKIVAE